MKKCSLLAVNYRFVFYPANTRVFWYRAVADCTLCVVTLCSQHPHFAQDQDTNCTEASVTTRCTANRRHGTRHVGSVLMKELTSRSSTPRKNRKFCSRYCGQWLPDWRRCGPSSDSTICTKRGSTSPSLVSNSFRAMLKRWNAVWITYFCTKLCTAHRAWLA